jgi:hypothetical protein
VGTKLPEGSVSCLLTLSLHPAAGRLGQMA